VKAEDWIKQKWGNRIRGDDLIFEEREVKLKETEVSPTTGEIVEIERSIGVNRHYIPIGNLADLFREVIEDDVNFPEKRKKRDGLKAANVNPDGTVKIPPEIWDRLLKEALGCHVLGTSGESRHRPEGYRLGFDRRLLLPMGYW